MQQQAMNKIDTQSGIQDSGNGLFKTCLSDINHMAEKKNTNDIQGHNFSPWQSCISVVAQIETVRGTFCIFIYVSVVVIVRVSSLISIFNEDYRVSSAFPLACLPFLVSVVFHVMILYHFVYQIGKSSFTPLGDPIPPPPGLPTPLSFFLSHILPLPPPLPLSLSPLFVN